MIKVFREKCNKFIEKWSNKEGEWNKIDLFSPQFRQIIIVFFIILEAGLFERFFYSPEVKKNYYGFLSSFNFAIHLIILYPLLTYFFNRRK